MTRLRELRTHNGLTQVQVAESVGVTRQTIIAIEKGDYVPSTELALRLAKYFAVSVEKIFWLDEVKKR